MEKAIKIKYIFTREKEVHKSRRIQIKEIR